MNKKKILSTLSLMRKAGDIAIGQSAVIKKIREGKAHLVLLSVDASKNTKKNIMDKSKYYHVPIINILTKQEIGRAVGMNEISVVTLLNKNFLKALEINFEEGGNSNGKN